MNITDNHTMDASDRDPFPSEPTIDAEDFDHAACKTAINDLLWTHLPGECTLGEADELACEILDMVLATYYKERK